jgi:2Fe-2S ferredoxin
MDNITITVTDADGQEHVICDVQIGKSLMEVARENAVPGIVGECGGACSCATCHVYVDGAWSAVVGPPDAVEDEMLDMVEHLRRPNSRLSCQIPLSADLAGLRVEVAPEL